MSIEGKRVAALIGDGFEEAELTEPRKALEGAGAIVTIVGLDDKARQRIRGKKGLDDAGTQKAEELASDVTGDDFDAVLIPGGTSPDKLRTSRDIQRLLREIDLAKKPIFAVGHGPQVLISSQIVRSRQLTGAASIADDIRNAGGLYRDQPVIIDGNWVTTRSASDMLVFTRAMLEKLASGVPVSPA